jgi:hypothetical protein
MRTDGTFRMRSNVGDDRDRAPFAREHRGLPNAFLTAREAPGARRAGVGQPAFPEWMWVTVTSTELGASFLIAFVTFATISFGV